MTTAAVNLYGWAVSLIATVLAAGNIALGVVLLLSPQRLNTAGFRYITGLHDSGALWWGAAFTISGIVALFGQYTHRMWPTRLAHSASAVGCTWWVLGFTVAATQSSTAGLTGCVAYALLGAVHGIVAVVSPHRRRW